MVVESLLRPLQAKHHPWYLFLMGVLYASLGLFLAYWVFPEQSSIVMVLFVVMAAVPLFYATMKVEEESDMKIKSEGGRLAAHIPVIRFFLFFFLGLVLAFSVWHVVLPDSLSTQVFEVQTNTISSLNSEVTGQVTGQVSKAGILSRIFLNNFKVMILSLFFSFLFGSGALFIITWNASVIGTAVGSFFSSFFSQSSSQLSGIALYASAAGLSILRYAIHGVPEILAYLVAALAGGILSAALIRGDWSKNHHAILHDLGNLVIIAVLVLAAAALLEVYVTPAVMGFMVS